MSGIASLMSPVGPKAEGFVNDQRFLTAIMGPFGSAKTTTCIRKIVNSALWQNPGPDGVRRVRWCCIRDTYGQLEANVMKSWFSWFRQTKDNWHGGRMEHTLRLEVFDGTGQLCRVEIEMLFRAMGDQKAEDVLKGLELTGLWLNETDTLDQSVFLFGWPRTGRYPPAKMGGCQWRGVIADFNAPDIDNWTYDFFVEGKLGLNEEQENQLKDVLGPRFGIGYWRQPGGLSKDPLPENIQNLPEGYYEGLLLAYANQPNYLRRFVHNEFGAVRNGQPVFPEFNEQMHVAREPITPDPNLPLLAGLDGGRTPAMIFAQLGDMDQLRVLGELVLFDPKQKGELARLGPTAFAEIAREFMGRRWPNLRFGRGFYDPAADFGEFDDAGTWMDIFKRTFGGDWRPGGRDGNRLEPRLEAVRKRLNRSPGGQPAYLLDPSCSMLRRGFTAGYIIERIKTSAGDRFRDMPSKNDFSHSQDGNQYLCLGLEEMRGRIIDDMDRRSAARKAQGPRVSYGSGYFSQRGH